MHLTLGEELLDSFIRKHLLISYFVTGICSEVTGENKTHKCLPLETLSQRRQTINRNQLVKYKVYEKVIDAMQKQETEKGNKE